MYVLWHVPPHLKYMTMLKETIITKYYITPIKSAYYIYIQKHYRLIYIFYVCVYGVLRCPKLYFQL